MLGHSHSSGHLAGLIGGDIGPSLSPALREREAQELGWAYSGLEPDHERMLHHFAELTETDLARR